MLRQITDSVSSIGATLLVLKTIAHQVEEGDNEMSLEVSSSLKSLIEEHGTFLRDSYEMTSHRSKKTRPPPEDFRSLPILPMPHELQEDFKPFLRANIVNGSYDNVHHYLDVHFRLLREDFIQPLREGIAEYRNALAHRKIGSHGIPRIQNLSVYENVIVIPPEEEDAVDYVIQFDREEKFKRVDWEHSKRLKGGCLLCLSPDNFQTLIFGIIKIRRPDILEKGLLGVTIQEMPIELLQYPLIMAESPSYFEAYKYVLHRLQNINQVEFPFLPYLVSVSTEGKLPKYVKNNPQIKVDVTCICESNSENERLKPSHRINKISLSEDSEWPTKEQLGFDDSQIGAYKAALREEICVIQGPPGTGKTFIGLKIVKTLLVNKNNWSEGEPLLVVCYTNHALDQFLESILSFEEGVGRLGGRSSSEKLKMRNIDLLIGRYTRNAIRQVTSPQPKEKTPDMIRCEEIIQYCAKYNLLSLHGLGQVVNEAHRQSLIHGNIQQNSNCILFWLFKSDEMYRLLYSNNNNPFHQMKHDFLEGAGYHDTDNGNYYFNTKEEYHGLVYNDNYDNNDIQSGSDNDSMTDDDDGDDFDEEEDVVENFRINDYYGKHPVAEQLFIHETEFENDNIPAYSRITGGQDIFQFVQMKLTQNDAMTRQEAGRITDIWALNVHQRWRLYMFWRNLFILRMKQKLEVLLEELERLEAIEKERKKNEIRTEFRKFSVIGATTTGAAKHSALLQILAPPIVIVEEAAEILEAHVITALSPNCQHLILIGDHQQLRPNAEVYKLCKDYKLDVSLFERLLKNGMPCHRLSTQHRMKPEISRLLKIHEDFYPGLIDHEMVTHYKDIRGLKNNLYFIEHTNTEEHNDDNKSRSNRHEATFLYALYQYLLKQGYSSSQITILTAYRGQVRTFKNIMGESFREVRVCPIDNFQGEENDIILFSFVRSNEEGNIGFLKVSNRICVALSRAREGLYCIGNFHLMSSRNALWKTITDDLRTRQCIGTHLQLVCQNHPKTFTNVLVAGDFKNVPDGGCSEPCDTRLSCGHTYPKKCHPEDREHPKIVCKKPCEKVMCELQHKCPLKCEDDCGDKCNEIIEHVCPNLHKRRAKCHLKSCQVRCESMLPCGHQCRKKCSESCTKECPEIVEKILPCGHEGIVGCYQNPEDVKCLAKCDKKLPCGHSCMKKCSDPCTNVCYETIQKILACGHEQTLKCFMDPEKELCQTKCGHEQMVRFYLNPKDVKCQAKCDKKLPCGHSCMKKCSDPCTNVCYETIQKILACGHEQTLKCFMDPEKELCQTKCGHEQMDRFYLNPKDVKCRAKCDKKLPCGHSCMKKCSDQCTKVCDKIIQKIFACGHEQTLKCFMDPEKVLCQTKCDKQLDCGHPCKNICSNPCTEVCQEMVQKELPCGHLPLTKCHLDPTKVTCQSDCETTLPCGHLCREKCSQKCTTNCKEIVTKTLSCGHIRDVECHLTPRCQIMVSKTFDRCNHVATVKCCEESCPKPCGTQLTCGHVCRGTCGECKNGTIHVKCKQPCEKRCMHSRCQYRCGDVCEPCVKPCPRNCQHARCGLKCGEECNRDPCNRSCRKRLRCQHRCVGLCGEPCPPLCRVCNKTWISWFLGRNDKSQTRFIYLLDCQHVVEEKEMDKLMTKVPSNGGFIKFPECPWCRTPIRFNPRYQNKLRKIWKSRELAKGQTEGQQNRTYARARQRLSTFLR